MNSTKVMKRIASILLVTVTIIVFIFIGAKYIIDNYEQISMTARNELRMDLNEGDPDAIEYYRSRYISRDIYLFDGPLTIRLMAERHGYDVEYIAEKFEESGYSSVQRFYDEVLA